MSGRLVVTGQINTDRKEAGCFYSVWEYLVPVPRDYVGPTKYEYSIKLYSPYDGTVVVEPAHRLTGEEVFKWINDHRDY